MEPGLAQLQLPLWQLIVRPAVIYLALLLGLRLFGKREVGQFTLFDLVLVLLVANAVQPAMTGPDTSLTGGLIIIAVLLSLNWVIGWLRIRSPMVRRALQTHPTVVAENGHWMEDALRREGVDPEEAEMALREHALDSIKQVKLAVLEVDGTISVVPTDSRVLRTRRRVRSFRQRL